MSGAGWAVILSEAKDLARSSARLSDKLCSLRTEYGARSFDSARRLASLRMTSTHLFMSQNISRRKKTQNH